MAESHTMHQKHIQLLWLLLEATQSRRALWRREGTRTHRTELAGIPCSLEFKHALLDGGGTPTADVVEVTMGTTTLTFYSGSEGHDLVEDILAAAYPDYLEQTRAVAMRLDAIIDRIETAA